MSDRSRKPISLYDVVARRLRAYGSAEVERLRAYAERPDPEDRFTALVHERLRSNDGVLDVGCGDGDWLRLVAARRVAFTVGVDYGIERLEHARDVQRATPIAGLTYAWADARHLPFGDDVFTILISRRGPLTASSAYLREGCRALRRGGLIFEIGIGEQDSREVYDVFGRGQMFGETARGPRVERLQALLREQGCTPFLAESLTTRVRLPGRDGLVFRLETTPMIDDFERERDAGHVDEVVRRHSSGDAILLTMHRLIVIARRD